MTIFTTLRNDRPLFKWAVYLGYDMDAEAPVAHGSVNTFKDAVSAIARVVEQLESQC